MSAHLDPVPITLASPEFADLLTWPYPDQPFYQGQVRRALRDFVPELVEYKGCRVWVFRDPTGQAVGFGTLVAIDYYARFAGGKYHPYVPVLGVHPKFYGLGYGPRIVEYLTAEAVRLVRLFPGLSDLLFLDVYAANQKAINLYRDKFHFVVLNPDTPIPDEKENNEPYFVMAKSLAIAPSPAPLTPPPPSP